MALRIAIVGAGWIAADHFAALRRLSDVDVDVVASDATLHLALDPEFALSGVAGGRSLAARSTTHPFEREIVRFLEAARTGDRARVFCTPRQALGSLAAALACEEALTSGATVSVRERASGAAQICSM